MTAATAGARNGKFVTFYSYKGGTGRSMALANVAWLLAACGRRVLAIDWDLEAPGLHRYFEPYIADKTLERSTGLVDFVLSFATMAVSGQADPKDPNWFVPYSDLLAHAVPIEWPFPPGGMLDFVPAGRQDVAYANRVNSFNWQNFYERLGGGVLFESVKQKLRRLYDFILVDSRTGVSDTAGICTVQIPDELVVCYTLNRQSIHGAAAAARSALQQRRTSQGESTLKVWPVPMRVERSEKDRLEIAQTVGRTVFTALMSHLDPPGIDAYWGNISVDYEPYYAYEEILAIFKDRPGESRSIFARIQAIAQHLSNEPLSFKPLDDALQRAGLAAYTTRSAWDYIGELELLANEYDRIRGTMAAGESRTVQMNLLMGRVAILAGKRDAGRVAEELFRRNTDGSRVVGIALARAEPQRRHIDIALDGISSSKSAFEQYHALLLLQVLMRTIDPTAAQQALLAIQQVMGKTITPDDLSRWELALQIVSDFDPQSPQDSWAGGAETLSAQLGSQVVAVNECAPGQGHLRYEDIEESHGPFVMTRGPHLLRVPRQFRIMKHLVTNGAFMEFVRSGGYGDDDLWSLPAQSRARARFTMADGKTRGPARWSGTGGYPDAKADHPVTGISFLEAQAFVQWCNRKNPLEGDWSWSLPPEDCWEFAARGQGGLIYPWGDAFDGGKCNYVGSGIGATSPVSQFEVGASPAGCCDMAGNVWEFVAATGTKADGCVLRGGSFKNTAAEVRSYLRLIQVPQWHRADDFGFRLVLVRDTKST
jgi:formylglycine-generating enzyme required for sulfatase activity/MinD-like ATPase involved in chromosome partitioning or flagellar assembly